MSPDSNSRTIRPEPDVSEDGSIHEEEYTTALPAFSSQAPKELKEKERRERGLRGVLPFQRKKKDKDRERDKEKEKEEKKEKHSKHKDKDSKDKDKDKERGILDLVERERKGEFSMGSMRGRPDKEKKRDDRDEEF